MRTTLLLLVLFLAGCARHSTHVRPLDRTTFTTVYVDLEATLWALKRTTGDTLVIARAADSVLASHGVTREQYMATVEWYNDDWTRWKGFYDDVGKQLEERSKAETRVPSAQTHPPGP